ncbi:MAG: hypothetical protein HZB50_13375 [Chloroflexi bacterium]|nr:hypothetical protein [Chloroflexota bacterium]
MKKSDGGQFESDASNDEHHPPFMCCLFIIPKLPAGYTGHSVIARNALVLCDEAISITVTEIAHRTGARRKCRAESAALAITITP